MVQHFLVCYRNIEPIAKLQILLYENIKKPQVLKQRHIQTMKYLTLIVVLGMGVQSFGQGGGQTNLPTVSFLSPQTANFVRYGNVPASHFTGGIDLKIPIYTYTDKDFEFPIFLGYNSSGFSPGQQDGLVGLNWFLNAGGIITRKVNGFVDERVGNTTSGSDMSLHGLYYGVKNSLAVKSKSKTDLFNLNGEIDATFGYWHVGGVEVTPDEFMFNMPGFSGRFFIENNGTVRTSGNRPFKVDLSGFTIQPTEGFMPGLTSTFTITTDDGYSYYFGGGKQMLEISYPYNAGAVQQTPVISGWYLTKIEAPSGRTALFEYEQFEEPGEIGNDKHYVMNVYKTEFADASTFHRTITGFGYYLYESGGVSSGNILQIKHFTKTAYLKKITIDKTTIEFTNGEKANQYYAYANTKKNWQLNAIDVKYDNAIVKHFELSYKYYGGTYPRLFLTSFREPASGSTFEFDYHKKDNLPNPLTHAVDHWGFWNGGDENGKLIPASHYYDNGDVEYVSQERDPNPAKCDVALLSKVTYPTGGYTLFTYQPHTYSRRLERRSAGNFLTQLYPVNGQCGGARIATIQDYNGVNLVSTRTFFYTKDYVTGGTQSSGILLSWPRYLFFWKYDDGTNVQEILRKSSVSFNTNYYPGENIIQYGEVTEVVSPSNGFTNYKFTNYETHPDFNDYNTAVVTPQTQQYITNLQLYNNFVGLRFNDRSFERGLPTEIAIYAQRSNGTVYPVKKTVTTYTSKDENSENYLVSIHLTGGLAQSSKLYYYPTLPSTETQTSYSDDGTYSASTVTSSTYNVTNYLSTKTSTASDGAEVKQKFKYPSDLITDSDDALFFTGTPPVTPTALYLSLPAEIKAMVDRRKNNMLREPIETIQYRNNKAIASVYIENKDFAGVNISKKIYPSKVWELKTDQPVSSFQETTINKGSSWTLTKSAFYGTEHSVSFDQYDDEGNLLQKTDKNLIKKSYIWGYDKMYPTTEVTGVKYDQFFYTGFEDNEGTVGVSKAGEKSRPGGYTKSISGLLPGTYLLSYWKKEPDDSWTQIKDEVVVSTNPYPLIIQSSIQLDELRLYPKSAAVQMSTYTYKPLIGMTSFMDATGLLLKYEYDSSGRLKFIKDFQGNILKMYEYNYQVK